MKIFVSLLIGISIITGSSYCVFAETDFIFENSESIGFNLTDKLSTEVAAEVGFNDNASKHNYTGGSIGFLYKFLDWLEGEIEYKQKRALSHDTWKTEHRPSVSGAIKWEKAKWKFKNRVKLEYRMKQDKDACFRFKNKFKISSPWKLTKFKINPYIADQIYIQEEKGFYRNKAYIGVGLSFFEHTYGDVYYCFEIDKNDEDWNQYFHIVGVSLGLRF